MSPLIKIKKIWVLISFIGILILSVDLVNLLFFASSVNTFDHMPIELSYQHFLIKYQIIFLTILLCLYFTILKKKPIVLGLVTWSFVIFNAILSYLSVGLSAGNIYEKINFLFLMVPVLGSIAFLTLSKKK
tara:strand:+ start:117 stop:509 length:393 start_codon:yes stop_codon:yes gene_type:complete